ncbi:hypothetical protein SAMN04488057_1192 [Cyclobacterium lianum]|uniref:Uncharacterized protein n=1 Tax=Cyclobacterium lianum TaxID=388280 RepID=A0A1M7QJ97_9BACT|nr:hypothetical protein SAMN04488057_1192 [Cyclobacterium lianum]
MSKSHQNFRSLVDLVSINNKPKINVPNLHRKPIIPSRYFMVAGTFLLSMLVYVGSA